MKSNRFIFAYFDTPRGGEHASFVGTDFPLLEKQMEGLERATGLFASFHDLTGVTYLVKELNLPVRYRSHRSGYCEKIKGSELFNQCVRCKYVTNFVARRKHRPFTGICHAGVWDIVFPVFFENAFLGTLFLGSGRPRGAGSQLDPGAYRLLPVAPTQGRAYLEGHLQLIAEVIGCCLRSHGLTGQFFKTMSRRRKLVPEPVHWLIRRVISLVEDRFAEPLSLSKIGKELKVRPQYLSRLFSEKQGMSLTQFIHRTRIRHAKEMLLTGRFNVTEVAIRAGFDDPSYFTRIFHKMEKKSPSEFLSSKI